MEKYKKMEKEKAKIELKKKEAYEREMRRWNQIELLHTKEERKRLVNQERNLAGKKNIVGLLYKKTCL